MPDLSVEPSAECPQCGAAAEPEQDIDLLFYRCPECRAEFGYQRIPQDGPACMAGLPVEIRVDAAQPPGVLSLESGDERRSVFLGNVIRRRPE